MYKMWKVMKRGVESRKSLGMGGPGEAQGEGAFKSTKQVLCLVESISNMYIFLMDFRLSKVYLKHVEHIA